MRLSPRNTQINLRVSAEFKAAAETAAAADNRSLTSFMETLVLEYLARQAEKKKR